ncbi:transcriptional regulator, LacI family [Streptococcus pneumoniae 2070335]|nr:bacterial regulatory s, lacI family protein [Streptococcus pneumoniae GA13494]EHE20705.1 bacterial regulatory s, lacI family protein [Streptococcus pneumoniae GA41437]EJG43653.1 transcriptional regulator, LacI family [Streptococcus pneumoniae 2070335]
MVEQRKSITMKDVALEAGVSVGTVSRVINKEKGIKEVTLKKVEQAIKTLNYIPDYYARGMKKIEQKRLQSLYQVSGIPSFQNLLCMWKMKSIREITNYSYVL